jgi:NADH-quinone oxidoreductase subunit A
MFLISLNYEYFFIAVFCFISFILSVFLITLSNLISYKNKEDTEKISAYECGFEPFTSGSSTFDVHFYVVGILFIIFDLEIVFLYP